MAISSMGAAIRTILVADLVMSLDNIIAIAAVAKGSLLLLVFGLALSIPLVVFTSTFLLRIMDRFPVIVTLGAALLGYVAGEMAVSDPLVATWIGINAAWLHTALPAAGVVLVVGFGKLLAARVEAEEETRPVAELAELPQQASKEDASMHRLLLPIDGSPPSLQAVERLLGMLGWYREPLEIHLLNVQHALHRDVGQFIAAEDVMGYHQDEGRKALAAARARLDQAGVPYLQHVVVGDLAAETIAHFAREKGIGQIIMCSHGRPAVGELLLGSVARGVLQHTDLPVTLVRQESGAFVSAAATP
jgi:nucleotide-binding universal stress UspA family protein